MTYDIRLECPDLDIICDACDGIEISDSIEGLIMLTLGASPNNWMGHPSLGIQPLLNLRPNSANRIAVEASITQALQWIVDLGNPIDVSVDYEGNALCVTIDYQGRNNICFNTTYGLDRVTTSLRPV